MSDSNAADHLRGKGRIARNAALWHRLAVGRREPNLILSVDLTEAFLHRPKCVVRSHLWRPERWPDTRDVPSLGEAMVARSRLHMSVGEMRPIIENDGKTRLY